MCHSMRFQAEVFKTTKCIRAGNISGGEQHRHIQNRVWHQICQLGLIALRIDDESQLTPQVRLEEMWYCQLYVH